MSISILGIFVADLAFFAEKIPSMGETIIGKKYIIGPGGKGSNQAVAAAKAGIKTHFISKIGDDQFGAMAKKIYDESGVDYSNVIISKEHSTGAAGILVNENSGVNAINVVPGAAGALTTKDIDEASDTMKNSSIFLTQLEVPKEVAFYSIKKAYQYSVKTILNPAPAALIDKEIFHLIDYFTPNETEASFYANHPIKTIDDARQAAIKILEMGVKNVIITLGEKGAYFSNNKENHEISIAKLSSPVVDTTGAGDAFNAGLAVAIAEGKNMKESLNFASATAGLSTTKIGTANSMPTRDEIEKIL
tara:strand:+ start:312 stop:1226 length:915 start_codon:yes stop_codon:yes gene_type:complete